MAAEFTFHFINSAILTVLVSLFVLWRYRVAVLTGMMRGGADALPIPAAPPRDDHRSGLPVAASLRWERRCQAAIALAYLLTTLICALPLAWTSVYLSGTSPIHTSQVLMLALVYTFACAPMIAASLSLSALRALAGLALLAILLNGLQLASFMGNRLLLGRPLGWGLLEPLTFLGLVRSQLWLIALFWLATWPRTLRGVAPITFAGLLLFGLAPFLGSRLTVALGGAQSLGLNTMFVLIALPVAWLAWLRLHRLARGYERKRFSDGQLLARTWWLMLVVNVGLQMTSTPKEPWLAIAACAVALFGFAPVNALLFSRLRRSVDRPPARTLLLLRVFGYARRTERLFDRIGARWRLLGPVVMIAAPDVAARTINPGDYLRWLTGRLDESFVASSADLAAKVDGLDTGLDPDGRYRVSALCCHDNTWQVTVVRLMRRADVVVMDVRGLTRARRGSGFELEHLAQHYPPQQLVLVSDASTEPEILEEIFGEGLARVRLVRIKRLRDIELVSKTALLAIA